MTCARVVLAAGIAVSGFVFATSAVAKTFHPSPDGVSIIAPDEVEDSIVVDGIRLSVETGAPLAIYDPQFAVTPAAPERMVQEYLRSNAELFQLRSETLDDLVHSHTRASAVGHTVRYAQTYQGIPVYEADLTVTVNREATVVFVMNSYRPNVHLDDAVASLSASVAREIALQHLNPVGTLNHDTTTLVVFHIQGQSRLVYQVRLVPSVDPVGDWEIMVDARSGEIVKAVDRSHYVDGTGSLFDADPLSSSASTYGDTGYEDFGDADTPELLSQIFSYTLRDISFNGFAYSLVGPWAEIRDFESPFNGTFSQASPDWDFTRTEEAFEASLTYWHVDNIMRYINEDLGTTCVPFQYTGGARFDPHGLGGSDNSHYISATGSIAFGDGGVDDAEDSDVVVHELGHAVHDWLTVGGLSQVNGLSEGFGDYLAASYSRSLGQWTDSDPQNQWVFSWDGHNPFWAGRVTNYGATYPGGLVGQVHRDGQIFSTCMMRIWDEIGRERIDKAVFEGLAMTNSGTNQQDAARAILQAAINMGYTESELASIFDNMTQTGYNVDNPVAVGDAAGAPAAARLLRNKPNPFNPTTTIGYEVVSPAQVRLAVYDAAGRLVNELVNRTLAPGSYSLTWDGRTADGIDVASGVYLIRLESGDTMETRRAVLLK